MCEEANLDMSHYEMQQVIWRNAASYADFADIEHRLANGKIADVYYENGETRVIIEVKSSLRDSLIKEVYDKYAEYCDYLVIAMPPHYPSSPCFEPLSIGIGDKYMKVGIWFVDWLGVTVRRYPRLLHNRTAAEPWRAPPP